MNILEIAQKLLDELQAEELANKHRAEGVVLLFQRIQQAYAEATTDKEQPNV